MATKKATHQINGETKYIHASDLEQVTTGKASPDVSIVVHCDKCNSLTTWLKSLKTNKSYLVNVTKQNDGENDNYFYQRSDFHSNTCAVNAVANKPASKIAATQSISKPTTNQESEEVVTSSTKPTPKATATKKASKPVPAKQTNQPTKKDSSMHPLSNFVPSTDWYDNYQSRDIAGIQDLSVLSSALRMGHNVMIAGPTGSAKTSLCMAFGAQRGLPVVNIPCNGAAEPSMFIGRHYRKQDGTIDFQLGLLAQAVLHGGIILLDEVNFLKPNIGAYLHSLLDGRRALYIPEAEGTSAPTYIKCHEDTIVIGAYNPEYIGTRPLNEAFLNRFRFKLDFPYLAEIEDALLDSDSILELGQRLRESHELGNISTPISTNLLIETEELAVDEELGFDFALNNFLSSFHADERSAVQLVLVQYAPRIYAELFGEEYPADGQFNPIV